MSTHPGSASAAPHGWTLNTALQLGRVSNLPTIWTNTLAGLLLVGAFPGLAHAMLLLVAMSFAYTGGMYLNDAFDREIDASYRPERPIPSGRVTAQQVFIAGFVMLGTAIALVTAVGSTQSQGIASLSSSAALALAIIAYNLWHKGNPFSPALMGLCRVLVYISCALTLSSAIPELLMIGALATFSYLIGLTYTAKQEQFGKLTTLWPLAFLAAPLIHGIQHAGQDVLTWACTAAIGAWTLYCLRIIVRRAAGDIPRAVTRLIAGIALIDALLIAIAANANGYAGTTTLCLVAACWAAFALTLKLQDYISGT